ncbi:MAG: enoyl-CoA hydratase [Betaproteobacteria bacterium]|nr:enoyl-CoA hydratase [Betaproteobacteria bacterium]NBP38065.1 enoyl-CoA hydratase [Betaproteobacteria bacterium]NBT82683.1 enoyl-CoA hydratase [Betaproteobacteria bacterium]NBY55298.1 enoyl-CoA hydratase [Betaproteobacteria bacterium]NCV12988.1 enoyl-CoA hydratase [Betaproteobacteria bacterium]
MSDRKIQFGNNTVLCAVDWRGVAYVCLNRPEVHNAYNEDMLEGLHQAMDLVDQQHAIRAVVLSAKGPSFQAGADLAWIASLATQGEAANLAASRQTALAVDRLQRLRPTSIALVHGACYGGGTGLIAACDVVIATERARFGITEARWGLVPSIILPHLIQAIGLRQLRRYLQTCEHFDAKQALNIGLVHELVADELALKVRAEALIDQLLRNAPGAVSACKARTLELAEALLTEDQTQALIKEHAARRSTEEAIEGSLSFMEQRNPAWYPIASKT